MYHINLGNPNTFPSITKQIKDTESAKFVIFDAKDGKFWQFDQEEKNFEPLTIAGTFEFPESTCDLAAKNDLLGLICQEKETLMVYALIFKFVNNQLVQMCDENIFISKSESFLKDTDQILSSVLLG